MDSCPHEAAMIAEQKQSVAEVLKWSSVILFDLFSANVKRLLDKCAVFQVKWYEHVKLLSEFYGI